MLYPKIMIAANPEECAKVAADLFEALIRSKPACVLGLATGSTPIPLYKELIAREKAGRIDFSRVRTANLDEYKGLPVTHDQSYRYFMNDNLFLHVNIDIARTNVPNGMAEDIEAECKRYDALVQSLGCADLQLLGMGHDGHIAFNEPCDHFPWGTHLVDLDPMTLEANARFFDNDPKKVPNQALTMGIGTIMSARKILMIVSGSDKSAILAKALLGPIPPSVPASALQLHSDVTVVADEAALADYVKQGGKLA